MGLIRQQLLTTSGYALHEIAPGTGPFLLASVQKKIAPPATLFCQETSREPCSIWTGETKPGSSEAYSQGCLVTDVREQWCYFP